ncbi:hypothetical protein BH11ARM1_BH11ARM1_11380 [soil metagenome]
MRMLFQFSQNSALLQLHVKALQGAINGFVLLDAYVNQIFSLPPQDHYYYTSCLSLSAWVFGGKLPRSEALPF